MRIPIKISLIPVAIAWMVIFLHGVIPHNHQQEHAGDCISVYHSCHDSNHTTGSNDKHAEGINESQQESHNHFICHFKAGPFHPLDNDTPFCRANDQTIRPEELKNQPLLTDYSQPYISRHIFLSDNLRAPPHFMG